MPIAETPWTSSSTSSGAAARARGLGSGERNLGLLAFRVVEVVTLPVGDESWKEDVDVRLVDSMSSSEALNSSRTCWSGQNCGWMRKGGGQGARCTMFRRASSFSRRFSSRTTYLGYVFESLIMRIEYITLPHVRTTSLDESHEITSGKEE